MAEYAFCSMAMTVPRSLSVAHNVGMCASGLENSDSSSCENDSSVIYENVFSLFLCYLIIFAIPNKVRTTTRVAPTVYEFAVRIE